MPYSLQAKQRHFICRKVHSIPYSDSFPNRIVPDVSTKDSSVSQASVGPGLQLHGPARSTDLFALRQQTATLLQDELTQLCFADSWIPMTHYCSSPESLVLDGCIPIAGTDFLLVGALETSLGKSCSCVGQSPFLWFFFSRSGSGSASGSLS